MAKLLKRDRRELETILSNAKTGMRFLIQERVAVMVESSLGSSDVFTAPYYPGKRYNSINKHMGSDLCALWTAVQSLEKFLRPEEAA